MFGQIALGSLLLLVTTLVHGACTVGVLRVLHGARVERWRLDTLWGQGAAVAALALLLFYVSLAEASLWAIAYVGVGALDSWEAALYFSIVTYTTLGYGDVTLDDQWRLLASFQAANGTLMFGWSTALIVSFVQRVRDAFKHQDGA